MRRFLLVTALCVVAASALPGTAAPHGIFLDSAYNTERNLKRKFPRVLDARCGPLPESAQAAYKAESKVFGTVRKWDHFICGVFPTRGSVCLLVVHMTGSRWDAFVVTSWRSRGCTSRQLRG